MLATQLSDIVDEAVRRLISVEHFQAGTIISMPVLYPSGATVTLELFMQKERVFISDRGGGYLEAEMIGASRVYAKEAQRIACEAGIKFDGQDMFVAEVPIDRINGALTVVASSSSQAASLAALRAADREEGDAKEALYERLSEVFGSSGYEKEVKLLGASNHSWRVDAVVKREDTSAVFNSVTKRYISAAGTAAKFHDLSRLELSPVCVAVVTTKADLGDWYGVISLASNSVLEINDANDQFMRFGKAA